MAPGDGRTTRARIRYTAGKSVYSARRLRTLRKRAIRRSEDERDAKIVQALAADQGIDP